ncbi:MAG TPA: hypothetical protein P5175_06245 [Anaerohalosphaeraceae bacterium]|nr:hypothetical protein [Anaerohalosphaeraceae bacterium]HRS71435.1 hypothetical protein [Anaerohalosphaeraceae bacterium]
MNAFILYGDYLFPYYRLVHMDDGWVWDKNAKTLAIAPAYGDSVLSLGNKDAVIKGWPVVLPEGLPNGSYDFQLYDAQVPSETDAMVTGWRLIMPHRLLVNPTEFPLDVFGRIRTTPA